MSKVIPNLLFTELSGRVLGQKSNTSVRTLYGKEHTYTYGHKPAEWSEAQIAMRQSFGVASYYARLICQIPEAKEHFLFLFRKQKQYHRLDNFTAHLISETMKTDESLRTKAFAAHQEHMLLRSKHAEHDAAVARQLIEAKHIWETKLKDA